MAEDRLSGAEQAAPATFDSSVPTPVRRLIEALAAFLVVVPIIWVADLPRLVLGTAFPLEQFAAFVYGPALAVTFLYVGADGRRGLRPKWYDAILALIGLVFVWWVAVRYADLADEIFVRRAETVTLALPILVLTIEAVRRTLGWVMLAILALAGCYALFGHLLSGPLSALETPLSTMAIYTVFGGDSLLGRALIIIATIVIVFIAFGQFFMAAGGGTFVTDMAARFVSAQRGGPAKIAIVSSGLFGSISGSVVSNVMSTGAITIPLMRRTGFPATTAGGIEAAASTGGQLMPPVMGAAAFLIAEFVGVSYTDVIAAAALPALLFFFTLLVQADQTAARLGISGLPNDEDAAASRNLRDGVIFLLPVGIIVVALVVWKRTPEWAGLAGLVLCVAVGALRGYGGHRIGVNQFIDILVRTGLIAINILIVGAAAGIFIGIIAMTGLGPSLGIWLLGFSSGHILVLLVLTAICALILGMGLATTSIYILVGTLLAPALIELEIRPLAAHLFVFYMGMMCMVTPPIAFAAFAASSLAGAGFLATAMASLRFGWCAFLLPFVFVFSPPLLLDGSVGEIILAVAATALGLWFVGGAVSGYLKGHIGVASRAALLVAGGALLYPGYLDPWAIGLDAIGLVLGAAIAFRDLRRKPAENGNRKQ